MPDYVLAKGKRLIANNSVGHIWTYSSWERLAFWNIQFIIFKLLIKVSSFEDRAVRVLSKSTSVNVNELIIRVSNS